MGIGKQFELEKTGRIEPEGNIRIEPKRERRKSDEEIEAELVTHRFIRQAPIRLTRAEIGEGYSIYCQDKAETRLNRQMCEGRQIRGRCPSETCGYRRIDFVYIPMRNGKREMTEEDAE